MKTTIVLIITGLIFTGAAWGQNWSINVTSPSPYGGGNKRCGVGFDEKPTFEEFANALVSLIQICKRLLIPLDYKIELYDHRKKEIVFSTGHAGNPKIPGTDIESNRERVCGDPCSYSDWLVIHYGCEPCKRSGDPIYGKEGEAWKQSK